MPLRIETERLILTPENEQDAEWLTELFNEVAAAIWEVRAREALRYSLGG